MTGRVAVVRGPALNQWEMQNFEPLRPELDVVAVGSRGGRHGLDGLTLPVRRLRTPSGRIARRLGLEERLLGLSRALAGARIVHGAETFIPSSEQIVRAKERHGFKVVLTCWENIPFLHDEDRVLRARKEVVRLGADLFLAVTRSARRALVLEGVEESRIAVLPMGVDTRAFAPSPRDEGLAAELGLPPGGPIVLYCGRLIREKGLIDLVLAARLLRRKDARLVLVGEGPERLRLEAAAERLGVSAVFVPPQPYDRMPAVHALADVFVLPSVPTPYWQEQFGMVLAEAMACGRPVVASASGSIPEVVDGVGVLVPPSSPEALAGVLDELLDDPARRTALGAAGRALAEERYDAERVAARLGELYGELLG